MPHRTPEQLLQRIRDLEQEVQDREKDISIFRKELASANQRLERLISELNHEIKLMHAIQRQLVPTEIPNIPGFDFSMKFVPSHLRGGDYFDVFEHQDRSHFGVIVASSSGYMMSALLLSVLLKMTGRLEARKGTDPKVIMKLIADELKPNLEGDEAADIFYGLFDRRQFTFSYCKVGDVSSMMQEYSSGELRLLKSKAPALSKNFLGPFETETVNLNPRDKLIFCTKGIVESRNLDGQEFGTERLFKSVLEYSSRGVHELRNQIFFQVQQFTNGQEPQADRTAVVAEVKDRVIKLAKK